MPEVTMTLDFKLDDSGRPDDMAAVVDQVLHLHGLPITAMRFVFVLPDRASADTLERELDHYFEARPWPVEAEVTRKEKGGLRRKIELVEKTPIERAIEASEDRYAH